MKTKQKLANTEEATDFSMEIARVCNKYRDGMSFLEMYAILDLQVKGMAVLVAAEHGKFLTPEEME